MFMSHVKKAEPIEMPFGMLTRMGPRNYVFDVGADPPIEWAIVGLFALPY